MRGALVELVAAEGRDLQRPDGELVTSIPKATQPSLIELRWSFLPEMITDFENL
jgi:hypothetical protein